MRWRNLAETALARLAAGLGPRGQWPGWVYPDAAPATGRRDISAPLTALGILALRDLPLAGMDEIVRRSREHIERTVQPGGLWRYYANIPPDTDDTAMCALALGLNHLLVRGQTADSLAATRLANGRFPTWFESGWSPVIDAVPNAHVVAVIGPGPTTDAAIAWLIEVVATGSEAAASTYYLDPLDLHMALTRAVAAGVEALQPTVEIAAARALERLRRGGLSPYRMAQALVVAAVSANPGVTDLSEAATRLAQCSEPDGGWPADTLYVAGNTELGGLWHYQSWAVVTALCVRALVMAATLKGS